MKYNHGYHPQLESNWLFTLLTLMPEMSPGLSFQCPPPVPTFQPCPSTRYCFLLFKLNTHFKILNMSFHFNPGYILEIIPLTYSIFMVHITYIQLRVKVPRLVFTPHDYQYFLYLLNLLRGARFSRSVY